MIQNTFVGWDLKTSFKGQTVNCSFKTLLIQLDLFWLYAADVKDDGLQLAARPFLKQKASFETNLEMFFPVLERNQRFLRWAFLSFPCIAATFWRFWSLEFHLVLRAKYDYTGVICSFYPTRSGSNPGVSAKDSKRFEAHWQEFF